MEIIINGYIICPIRIHIRTAFVEGGNRWCQGIWQYYTIIHTRVNRNQFTWNILYQHSTLSFGITYSTSIFWFGWPLSEPYFIHITSPYQPSAPILHSVRANSQHFKFIISCRNIFCIVVHMYIYNNHTTRIHIYRYLCTYEVELHIWNLKMNL